MRLSIRLAIRAGIAIAAPYFGLCAEEEKTTWTMAISGIRVEEPTGPVVDIWAITATSGELIASCRFGNTESTRYLPTKVIIEGEWRDGFFWPAVTEQIGDVYRGPWYTIPVEAKKKKLSKIEVLPGQVMSEWRLKLNNFLPYVGNYAVGRVVFTSKDFAVFELPDLKGARN